MIRTALPVFVYITANAAGDVLLTYGMRQDPISASWVTGGVASFALGYGVFLALLRSLPMSVVVPVGAGSYLLVSALSRLALGEWVPLERWFGTFLIAVGVALIMVSERPAEKAAGEVEGALPHQRAATHARARRVRAAP